MRVLRVQPSDICNLNCPKCACKKYNRAGTDESPLVPMSTLLLHILKHFDPKDTLLEITGGGEPTMRKLWVRFIKILDRYGFKGEIRTNGILYTPKTKGFVRVTAWHGNTKTPPPHWDKVLIIKNPNENWHYKVEYCKKHVIPYYTTVFKDHDDPPECRAVDAENGVGTRTNGYIKRVWAIYPDGNCRACDRRTPDGKHPNIMNGGTPKLAVCHCDCAFAFDFEQHMTAEMIEHCDRYYAEQLKR